MTKLITLPLRVYKRIISPLFEFAFGNACRYTPTCSDYAKEALEKHGIAKGSFFALRRILSCHPYSKKYWDPVPEVRSN